MPYPFGKAISYTFYPISDREFVSLSGVTTSPAIHIYKEGYKPDRTSAAAGTNNGGLVESIVTWADTTDGNGKTISIAAISDPDPTASTEERTYWIAINFYLTTGGQKQTLVKALPMHRVYSHAYAVGTSIADLEAIYAGIDSVVSNTNQTSAITTATTQAKIDLEASGFEWSSIWRPDRLNTAIAHKALSYLMLGLMNKAGDEWQVLSQTYNGIYESIRDGLKLEWIDSQDDDPADNEPVKAGGVARIIV